MNQQYDMERLTLLLDAYILDNLDEAGTKELLTMLEDPAMSIRLEQLIDSQLNSQHQRYKNDIEPGRSGAILTIEGKKSILLDTVANGQVSNHFIKNDTSISVESKEIEYATLSTPIKRTEKLNLSDGSIVWLNAASSIRFPTVFTGETRTVEITGEVYIQVAHNDKMPFRVLVKGQVIEDIGTEFNINAYDNERVVKTTLIEGSIKVINKENSQLLNPGEQSQSNVSGRIQLVRDPDMEQTLAWKNGLFRYNGASMESIMNQVARWYGVEIVYQDEVPGEFVARIPRDVPVSRLLTLLEGTKQVRFKIEGQTITVMK